MYIYMMMTFFETKQFSYEWEKRQNKRYGRITSICRQIGYGIKQGATIEQVLLLLQKLEMIRHFSLRQNDGSIKRLDEIEKHFMPSKQEKRYYWY